MELVGHAVARKVTHADAEVSVGGEHQGHFDRTEIHEHDRVGDEVGHGTERGHGKARHERRRRLLHRSHVNAERVCLSNSDWYVVLATRPTYDPVSEADGVRGGGTAHFEVMVTP